MHDIEQRFATWREQARAALPGRPEVLRELEEHLRDHMAELLGQGSTPDEAFTLAARRLGEPGLLAGDFELSRSRFFGSLYSSQLRFLAYVAGSIALAGWWWHARHIVLLMRRYWATYPPTRPESLFDWSYALTIVALCTVILPVCRRFLEQPSVARARAIVAFLLFVVWLLTGYAVSPTSLPLAAKWTVVLLQTGILGLLWAGWIRHLERVREAA